MDTADVIFDMVYWHTKPQHGSSFTLTPRSAAVIISILSLISCTIDMKTLSPPACECPLTRARMQSLRRLLLMLSQAANLLLLGAAAVENAFLVQLYVYFTLSFVMMALMGVLTDFLMRARESGVGKACLVFLPEVAFLFVLFRCLPLVDQYARDLQAVTF